MNIGEEILTWSNKNRAQEGICVSQTGGRDGAEVNSAWTSKDANMDTQ